jgi:hypothetical protein
MYNSQKQIKMKQILNVVLMMFCAVWWLVACRTTNTVERRTQSVENQQMTKVDSVTLQTADSVLVMVEKDDSMVRIVERTVKWRERVKVQRDTVRVYLSNDTIIKKVSTQRQPTRNPPNWKLFLAFRLFMIALLAIAVLTIKKHLKL